MISAHREPFGLFGRLDSVKWSGLQMQLEEQVTECKIAYIEDLIYDVEQKTLTISFTRWGDWAIYGTLTFTYVIDYQAIFDTEDDQKEVEAGILSQSLVAIEEKGAEASVNYLIVADCCEYSFSTASVPNWSRVEAKEIAGQS